MPHIHSNYRIASRQDFTADRVFNILSLKNWVILTPENPNGIEQSEELNAALRERFEDWLVENRVPHIRVRGNYGYEETSYILLDVSFDNAVRLGRLLRQQSILTREGLVTLSSMEVNPAESVKVAPALRDLLDVSFDNAFYTTLPDGTRFCVVFEK